jgi:hypothetical protein
MIEAVHFGSMTIDGRKFTSDLLIFPDGRVVDQWLRGRGHLLTLADIGTLVARNPAVIVVGSGIFGRMKPENGLAAALTEKGIELVVAPSRTAGDHYNHVAQHGGKAVAACFHLTC